MGRGGRVRELRRSGTRAGPDLGLTISSTQGGREPKLVNVPERLERAYDREARIVALDIIDREAILRVLEECPEELLELRAALLQERVWLQREGLA